MQYPYHYLYLKAAPPITPHRSKPVFRLVPPALITVGSILIVNVLWPLLSYQIFSSPGLQKPNLTSPVPPEYLGSQPTPVGQVMGASVDYTNPQNWFPGAQYPSGTTKPASFTLDIPSLNINQAQVVLGGSDLSLGLIQYPGTAEPGKYGAPVIFGHSVLRQFYNPAKANPRRYLSIFSKIMTLKPGNRIYLDYDHVRYTYEVKDKTEVPPDDLSVLTQRLDNRLLKLITCVPEGTYLRRGVITAQLINLSSPNVTNVITETGL